MTSRTDIPALCALPAQGGIYSVNFLRSLFTNWKKHMPSSSDCANSAGFRDVTITRLPPLQDSSKKKGDTGHSIDRQMRHNRGRTTKQFLNVISRFCVRTSARMPADVQEKLRMTPNGYDSSQRLPQCGPAPWEKNTVSKW